MNLFEWLFRDRETGRITIWQQPNVAARAMVAGAVVHWLFPGERIGRIARGVSGVAVVLWALGELFAGANPSRRVNGAGMLALQLRRLLR